MLAPVAAVSATNLSRDRTSELHLMAVLSTYIIYCTFKRGIHCGSPLPASTFCTPVSDCCRSFGAAVDINPGSVLQMPGLPCPPWMDCERSPHDVPVLLTWPRARQVLASERLQVALLMLMRVLP